MCKEVRMTLEKQRILRLYKLLEKLEDSKQNEDAALIRWTIFELEQKYGIKAGEIDTEE